MSKNRIGLKANWYFMIFLKTTKFLPASPTFPRCLACVLFSTVPPLTSLHVSRLLPLNSIEFSNGSDSSSPQATQSYSTSDELLVERSERSAKKPNCARNNQSTAHVLGLSYVRALKACAVSWLFFGTIWLLRRTLRTLDE